MNALQVLGPLSNETERHSAQRRQRVALVARSVRVEGFCGAIACRLVAAIEREVTKTLTLSLEIGAPTIKDYPVYVSKR